MKPFIFCILFIFFTFPNIGWAEGEPPSPIDSIKYKGYRLELTDFRLVKKKGDWIKVEFDIVNSGRMNVDMSRKGTEYWVVFKFDQSLFSIKMGGYREHIKQQLAKEGFKLEKGKILENVILKIPSVLPSVPRPVQPPIAKKEPSPQQKKIDQAASNLSWGNNHTPTLNEVEFVDKGGSAEMPVHVRNPKTIEEKTCPDILITDLKIIKQDDRQAILEYTVTNQGSGSFFLFGKNSGSEKDNLFVNAYLSGVTTLTRGALPVGGNIVTEEIRSRNELKKGESFTGRLKVDVRKKTRYMKSLILNLESNQYALECDRKNNDRGIVLE